jgi:hypothetical protein
MTVSCYVSESGSGSARLLTFIEVPRVGDSITLPDLDDDFEVVSVHHFAQAPSGHQHPAVQIYLAIRPRKGANVSRVIGNP